MLRYRQIYNFLICLVVFMLSSGLALTGVEQKPAYILLIDTSGSMKAILPYLKQAAIGFVSTLPDSTQVHLATFHSKGERMLSIVLSEVNRLTFQKALTNLRPNGRWTHFAAVVEAIRSTKMDSSMHYKALIFTDQLGDPRPGFKDIGINDIAVHLPRNIKVYVISSSQALASIGNMDSTGFVTTPSGATGVAADMKSSKSIFDQLNEIATRKNVADAIRPRPKLPIRKTLLLSLIGLGLVLVPILVQMVRRESVRELTQTRGWVVTVEDGSDQLPKHVVYPNQHLIVGSTGSIKVAMLPPVAAEFVCNKSLRLKPNAELQINGHKVQRTTELNNGDRIVIENRVHLVVHRMEANSGFA